MRWKITILMFRSNCSRESERLHLGLIFRKVFNFIPMVRQN